MNLIANAVDAVGGAGRIQVRVTDPGRGETMLEVRHDGAGIAEDIRDRIFEPYFTTKERTAYQGGGLGLATVYGIVQGHEGKVEVESEPGRGTTLRVLFPSAAGEAQEPSAGPHDAVLQNAVQQDAALQDAGAQGAGAQGDAPARQTAAGDARVLVVEDVDTVRYVTERALTSLGFEVTVASDGLEAIQLVSERGPFDVVLLDVQMPGIDGPETCRRLRKAHPDVGIVFITGYALDHERQGLYELGADGVLAKPIDVPLLARELNRVIARRREEAAVLEKG